MELTRARVSAALAALAALAAEGLASPGSRLIDASLAKSAGVVVSVIAEAIMETAPPWGDRYARA
jgi:hypothetical protein